MIKLKPVRDKADYHRVVYHEIKSEECEKEYWWEISQQLYAMKEGWA